MLFNYNNSIDAFKDINPEPKKKDFYQTIVVHFKSYIDKNNFEKLTGISCKDNNEIIFNRGIKRKSLIGKIPNEKEIEKIDNSIKWRSYYNDMPEYISNDCNGITITINFNSKEDVEYLSRIINQPISEKAKYIWFPKVENISMTSNIYN